MEDYILQIAREGLFLALIVSAPPVLTSMFIGLIVSIVQATLVNRHDSSIGADEYD